MIGDDRRRKTTDQLRAFSRANEGQVEWNTEAPADFTYLYHPDRVLVRQADIEEFEGIARQVGERLFKGEPRRDDYEILGGALARYVLPERTNGESVPDGSSARRLQCPKMSTI